MFDPNTVHIRTGSRKIAKHFKQPENAARKKMLEAHEKALAKLGVKRTDKNLGSYGR